MALREDVPVYLVSMIAPVRCRGCSRIIPPRENAIFYNDSNLKGHYHNLGEVESVIDVWEEGHSSLDEEIEFDNIDPVLKRVKEKLGIK